MAAFTFGITSTKVHDHHFAQVADFDTTTKPTAAIVLEMVNAAAGTVAARVLAKGVSASAIETDAGATYPAAYAWCQDATRLGAAIRVSRVLFGGGKIVEDFEKQLADKFEQLTEEGAGVLGDAPLSVNGSNGPRSHVQNHNIDTGDTAAISTLANKFRRDDAL